VIGITEAFLKTIEPTNYKKLEKKEKREREKEPLKLRFLA